jgi:hypothetical protein
MATSIGERSEGFSGTFSHNFNNTLFEILPENYRISGPDAGQFMLDAKTGLLTFSGSRDFENPTDADGNGVYNFSISYRTLTGFSTPKEYEFKINDVNEPASSVLLSASAVPENQGAFKIGALSTNDPDAAGPNNTYTYSLDASSPFEIKNVNELWVKAGAGFNFEATPTVTVVVTADPTGVNQAGDPNLVKSFVINVQDVFEGGGLNPPSPPPVDPTPNPNAPFDGNIAALVVSSFVNGKTPLNAAKLESLANFAEGQHASYTEMGVGNPEVGPYEALGRGFSTTAEFKAKYDALGEDAFIAKVYNDVLGRAATDDQVDHFQAQIDYFQGIYETADVADAEGTLYAKGAVLGQILAIAVLEEGADHYYAGAANAFIVDAADGVIQWGLPLSHWEIA